MGQKTHPRGLRLGIIETWDSQWYSEKQYADWLHEDLKIQNFIKEQLFRASIATAERMSFSIIVAAALGVNAKISRASSTS